MCDICFVKFYELDNIRISRGKVDSRSLAMSNWMGESILKFYKTKDFSIGLRL